MDTDHLRTLSEFVLTWDGSHAAGEEKICVGAVHPPGQGAILEICECEQQWQKHKYAQKSVGWH